MWEELQLGRFESDSFQLQTKRIQSHVKSTEADSVGGPGSSKATCLNISLARNYRCSNGQIWMDGSKKNPLRGFSYLLQKCPSKA